MADKLTAVDLVGSPEQLKDYLLRLARRLEHYVDPDHLDSLQWLLKSDRSFVHVGDILVGVSEDHLLATDHVLVVLDAASWDTKQLARLAAVTEQQAVLTQRALVPLEVFFDQLEEDYSALRGTEEEDTSSLQGDSSWGDEHFLDGQYVEG